MLSTLCVLVTVTAEIVAFVVVCTEGRVLVVVVQSLAETTEGLGGVDGVVVKNAVVGTYCPQGYPLTTGPQFELSGTTMLGRGVSLRLSQKPLVSQHFRIFTI